MSAPTFPNRPPGRPEWLAPRPVTVAPSPPARRLVLSPRSTFGTVVDIAARIGTAVTLVALMVLTGTVLAVHNAEPVPIGAATTGR